MCNNYTPAELDELGAFSQTKLPLEVPPYRAEAYPMYEAPFLANMEGGVWKVGAFGMVPHWADPKLGRQTYNARSETVAQKPSFRSAWSKRQLCIIPVKSFFEPNYESGKPVRWRIERVDGKPFGLAGLWERRLTEEPHWSFTMLTINADEHPLMRRFHRPGDEKRSVVILAPDEYERWLHARAEADLRSFLRPFDADVMTARPAPRSS